VSRFVERNSIMEFLVVVLLALISVSFFTVVPFSFVTAAKAPFSSLTFKATSNKVRPTKFWGFERSNVVKDGDELSEFISKSKALDPAFDTIVQTSTIPESTYICHAPQGLVSAIVQAYNTHAPQPDSPSRRHLASNPNPVFVFM